jgi:hypothetical protein
MGLDCQQSGEPRTHHTHAQQDSILPVLDNLLKISLYAICGERSTGHSKFKVVIPVSCDSLVCYCYLHMEGKMPLEMKQ